MLKKYLSIFAAALCMSILTGSGESQSVTAHAPAARAIATASPSQTALPFVLKQASPPAAMPDSMTADSSRAVSGSAYGPLFNNVVAGEVIQSNPNLGKSAEVPEIQTESSGGLGGGARIAAKTSHATIK